MLRFHFSAEDLARTRVAPSPHPLWEIACSLHRFQTRSGRWNYADWYERACGNLEETGLAQPVRTMLLPLFPRARYFADFLTPFEGVDGLEPALEAILATPEGQVNHEMAMAARASRAPSWTSRVAEKSLRGDLVNLLRAYHRTVIAPQEEDIRETFQAERARHARNLLAEGTDGLLAGLSPAVRWRHPVLEVPDYPDENDVYLNGRGLLLIPSYFCWKSPIALADPGLPPVLVYAVHHVLTAARPHNEAALNALLGRTRAVILRAAATGVTTGEAARRAGVSTGTATHHTTALRDSGLITTHRNANSALHTLTTLGAALLGRAAGNMTAGCGTPSGEADGRSVDSGCD
ncbi:ArsR family transcriptional regulator [Streptomyces sp. WI04-05B]|nr:ArsR family transcriptional regulator [Streptomyces sp. WI04-05B]MDX2582961.1 ArsR family transcriptional regulator [Streptomyces sp. WI04-05A]MDX3746724.1 ArsR family transcriptional regulator [Streptomyces sp. AK08-02]